jgi:hypothetical protein
MALFWDVARCNLVDTDRHFREMCCLHYQGLKMETVRSSVKLASTEGVKTQNKCVVMLTAVKNSDHIVFLFVPVTSKSYVCN